MKNLLLFLLLTLSNFLVSNELNELTYKYELPKLPYSYGALEPHIDKQTMTLHHNAHHKSYVEKLNDVISKNPELQKKDLGELLTSLDEISNSETRKEVLNNGGGHWNHSFFWKIMQKNQDGKVAQPTKKIAKLIDKKFGSFKNFQEKFNAEAKKVFGSGWAWLSLNKNNELIIHSTKNQDSPISDELNPILGLDVWEHAYYLKYQNKRPDYITSWWYIINWDQVEKNYNDIINNK